MPRIPRLWVVHEGASCHKIWRAHNGEFNIGSNLEKLKYLDLLKIEHHKKLKKTKPITQKTEEGKLMNPLHALCLMSNHTHEIYTITDLNEFSGFMRRHHSRYGQYFNYKEKRKGKVAQDRPLTSQIENDEYHMMATFYIHANPVRANICRDAKDFIWSTHRLYAFGKKTKWMKTLNIVFPDWYLNLGETMEERQRVYRQLFEQYLIEYGLKKKPISVFGTGSLIWIDRRRKNILSQFKEKYFSG